MFQKPLKLDRICGFLIISGFSSIYMLEIYFFIFEHDIWPWKRYDQTQNNRYSENKRRIHAIKLQVEKDQKNADRLAEEQMKQAQEMVLTF